MNILLTGGSGFLGSALAKALQSEGHQVSLLLRPSSLLTRLTPSEHLFKVWRCEDTMEIANAIEEAAPDFVIHAACSYGRRGETDYEILDANFLYGAKILHALSELDAHVNFINTGTPLPSTVSIYALSKQKFSLWGQAVAQRQESKVRFVNIILQNVYGVGDDPSKFTSKLIDACQHQVPEFKLTHGLQKRDWIYIDDAVSAFLSIVRNFTKLEHKNVVGVGSGIATTVREFAETVKILTKSKTELLFGEIPYRTNEPMHCQADLSTIAQIGWKPIFDLETGLKKTIFRELSK